MSKNTTSSERVVKDGKVSWNQYDGTKESHDVNVTQMNIKSSDGTHSFYNSKQGREGVAGPNAERTSKK